MFYDFSLLHIRYRIFGPSCPIDDYCEEEGSKECPGVWKLVWERGRCQKEPKKNWWQVDEVYHQEPDGLMDMFKGTF